MNNMIVKSETMLSVTTSESLYAHVTNKNPVILPKSILGIISIISSRTREVSGRSMTEANPLPGPREVRID